MNGASQVRLFSFWISQSQSLRVSPEYLQGISRVSPEYLQAFTSVCNKFVNSSRRLVNCHSPQSSAQVAAMVGWAPGFTGLFLLESPSSALGFCWRGLMLLVSKGEKQRFQREILQTHSQNNWKKIVLFKFDLLWKGFLPVSTMKQKTSFNKCTANAEPKKSCFQKSGSGLDGSVGEGGRNRFAFS